MVYLIFVIFISLIHPESAFYCSKGIFISDIGNFGINDGKIWLKKGNTKKAIQCFNRALSINQAMPEVWFELGTVYLIMKNAKSAESCISKAVKYDPKNKQYRQLLLSLALQRQQKINYDK